MVMKKTLDTPTATFSPKKAIEVTAVLNEDDGDDWVYKVKHDPKGTGYSLIEVYDENGEFVSLL